MSTTRFNRLIKILLIVFIVLLLASVSIIVAACKCNHEYQEEVTKPATCTSAGEITYTCGKCGDFYTETIPMLDGHVLSLDYLSNDSEHWQQCENCDYKTAKVEHEYTTILSSEVSTCVKKGSETKSCVCGKTHIETLPLAQHSYTKSMYNDDGHWIVCAVCGNEDISQPRAAHDLSVTSIDATCDNAGERVTACSECEYSHTETLPALEHDLDRTQVSSSSTLNGHYYHCNRCGKDIIENHTLVDCECLKGDNCDATCYKPGHQDQKCSVCGWRDCFLTPMTNEHNWSAEWSSNDTFHWHGCTNGEGECTAKCDETQHAWETKVTPATCDEDGREWRECSVCGLKQKGYDIILTATGHDPEYYPAKEMTDTEPGNINYWQCTVCGRYFKNHGCVDELFEEDIFTYPPTVKEIESVAQLVVLGQKLSENIPSNDYYQVTATVEGIMLAERTLMIGDGESVFATLIDREQVDTIKENDCITLKGKLIKSDNDVSLIDCEVISVDGGVDGKYSLSITMTEGYSNVYMYAYVVGKDDWFTSNTNYYNCLSNGDVVAFNLYIYGQDVVLQKVIINGTAYTMTDGVLEITVNEDIRAEFVLARTNKCSVRIYELDTSNNNGNYITVDEYVSYAYTNGGYNDDGRLHKNSHLTFAVNNANITGINITYDAAWLASNSNTLNNTINAIRANGTKVSFSQGSANGNSQVVITLSEGDVYTALEYFANASQARITEIIVLYETHNTAA